MKPVVLLITDIPPSAWARECARALEPIARVRHVRPTVVVDDQRTQAARLIVIDATAVHEFAELLIELRRTAPGVGVVVITASPHWRSARLAFESGALDYLSKSVKGADLIAAIEAAMNKPAAPRAPVRGVR